MDRRTWMLGIGAAVGLAGLGLYARRRAQQARHDEAGRVIAPPPARPAGVPVGPFGAGSTALEVTEGLDLTGRTMLVTGVTSGVGLETMRVLALRGAHVIGTGRSLARAREACASVRGRTTPVALELTDFPSVVACAEAVLALGVPLDALVCNAGVMALRKLEQVAGIERQFATNHLGHFLLVHRLLAALQAAPQGRVVVVSSGVLGWSHPAGIEWDNLSGARDYDPNRAYGQSKLANALFALELARRFEGSAATANALHPGYVDTKLFRHYPWSLRGFHNLLPGSGKLTVAQGAATSCYVATAPALAGVSGQFFQDCNPVVPDARARDAAAAARLWGVSEGLVAAYLG
jgi:NAD(P)-dependent dehydrogenase (short-subunit alcohol dehydrogenase family)